jgi:hypothetical protein
MNVTATLANKPTAASVRIPRHHFRLKFTLSSRRAGKIARYFEAGSPPRQIGRMTKGHPVSEVPSRR